MKKFFSVLFSILFAVCLLLTLLLSVVRFNLNYSAVTNLASQMLKPVSAAGTPRYDDGLFHPEDKVISLTQYEFDASAIDLSAIDFSDLAVNEIVQVYLDEAGIDVDPEFVAEVLASSEISDFVDKYAAEIVDYMTGAKTELDINPDDIKKVVNKSLDMFEEHTGEVVDRTGMDAAIEDSVAAMLPEITTALDTAKEVNAEVFEGLKCFNLLLSTKIFVIAIAVCVLLALIIFLLNMNIFVAFKFISIPLIVDGLLIFLAGVIAAAVLPGILSEAFAEVKLPGGIYEAIVAYAASIFGQLKIYGVVSTLCGVVLCVLGFKLGKTITVQQIEHKE